ncbi:hypothetical protein B0H19DRAFT_1275595 [Mycena capillaripes]|nr:hypothetical protein B0H19DRAFT_1275595 [Mycena capillaripes]
MNVLDMNVFTNQIIVEGCRCRAIPGGSSHRFCDDAARVQVRGYPGLATRINALTVSIEEKLSLWKGQYRKNFGMILAAVFQNRKELEHTPNLGIFIKLVGQGPDYEHRSFVIEQVALIPWTPVNMGRGAQQVFACFPGAGFYLYTCRKKIVGTLGQPFPLVSTHLSELLGYYVMPC